MDAMKPGALLSTPQIQDLLFGALCVFDQEPRRASQVDEVLLRRLALQVQQQLHGQLVG